MEGKVALITGASSGIGRATALALAKAGARLVIANRTRATGEAVAAEIRAVGSQAIWLPVDVTQPEQVEALIQETVRLYGRLDIAFNNGGSGDSDGPVHQIDEDAWHSVIQGYLTSTFYCLKYELQVMVAQGSGSIVNNSSVDGQRAFPWDPGYAAAKHGVLGLTKSAALQYARQGIRINAICPGWVDTPLVTDYLVANPEKEAQILARQPIGRLGTPEEIAAAVLWLCSDAASFVTGAALAVDGGYLAV